MRLPIPRGPNSAAIISALAESPSPGLPSPAGVAAADDEDLQLVLAVCYELHYGGFVGVDDSWEWSPSLLEVRAAAERRFLVQLLAGTHPPRVLDPARVPRVLDRMIRGDPDTGLSRYLEHRATWAQFREFAAHRSIYQLKEADPHTWAIPRLTGVAKAALVEIQADEYGGGVPGRMHSQLFAATMRGLDLDDAPGALLDAVPAVSLAAANVVSLFGLHRRWRGALLGHLAVIEMDSAVPNRAYRDGARRLGLGPDATAFFDEHVEADAVHEQIAAHQMCGTFARENPALAGDVVFGATCALSTYGAQAHHLMNSWAAGETSLRAPLPELWSTTVPA